MKRYYMLGGILLMICVSLAFTSAAYVSSDSELTIYSGNDNNYSGSSSHAEQDSDFRLNGVLGSSIKINGEIRENTRVTMSNGTIIIVKISSTSAEQRAEERMNVSDCEQNCSVEMKEKTHEGRKRVVYEIKGKERVKLFGFIRARSTVSADVDAQTGEVFDVNHSWWAFASTRDEAYYREN